MQPPLNNLPIWKKLYASFQMNLPQKPLKYMFQRKLQETFSLHNPIFFLVQFLLLKKTIYKLNFYFLFDWIKGAELIELKECDTSKDPVRPELDNDFRTSYGRKIYGVKYKGEIHAVMCFAFTNKIPKTVKELDLLSQDAFLQSAHRGQKVGKIAIAYTVWSTKKGGGKLIVKEVFKIIKKSNHLNRLVTLSPLTDMARKFHLRNGAIEVQVNESTQNFEYKIMK